MDAVRSRGARTRVVVSANFSHVRTLNHKANMLTQKIHQGDLVAKPGTVYQFEEITGYLYARGADTKTAFPKLTNANAGGSAKKICHKALLAALAIYGLTLEDGILARVISARGGVKRVRIVGQSTTSYIVQREGHTAHGKTLAEARADLLLKMGNRDTTPYRKWTTDTTATLQEMIVAYRTVTGACQQGVSHFLTSKNYKGKLSVQFVIDETRGQYGHEIFKAFFL